MSLPLSKPDSSPVNYGVYRQWTDEERWEIIEGVPYDMGPAPSTKHQSVLGELFFQIRGFLSERDCRVFMAPFDVRLPESDEADDAVTNVVQPDITVICDPSKIDKKGCRGAPDWIIEVLSPGTSAKDYNQKRILYERRGVREYWLVHPLDELITIFVQGEDGKYLPPEFREGKGKLEVKVLPDLALNLETVFR